MGNSTGWERLAHTQDGEILELQGFLSQMNEERWIITCAPLKTCCMDSPKKEARVTLLGNFSHHQQNSPLRVRGRLETLRENKGGAAVEEYRLIDVIVFQQESTGFPVITIGILFLSLMGFFFLKRASFAQKSLSKFKDYLG